MQEKGGVHTISFPNGSSIDFKEQEEGATSQDTMELKSSKDEEYAMHLYEKAEEYPYPPTRERLIPEWKKRRSDGIKRNRHHRHGKRNR